MWEIGEKNCELNIADKAAGFDSEEEDSIQVGNDDEDNQEETEREKSWAWNLFTTRSTDNERSSTIPVIDRTTSTSADPDTTSTVLDGAKIEAYATTIF
jgi:hypothetical protein